jgi:hypothetical protein
VLGSVFPVQRHRPTPLIKDLPNFGLVHSSFFLGLIIIFMILTPPTSKGLLVNLKERNRVARQSLSSETLGAYVDGKEQFYVNGKRIRREEL